MSDDKETVKIPSGEAVFYRLRDAIEIWDRRRKTGILVTAEDVARIYHHLKSTGRAPH